MSSAARRSCSVSVSVGSRPMVSSSLRAVRTPPDACSRNGTARPRRWTTWAAKRWSPCAIRPADAAHRWSDCPADRRCGKQSAHRGASRHPGTARRLTRSRGTGRSARGRRRGGRGRGGGRRGRAGRGRGRARGRAPPRSSSSTSSRGSRAATGRGSGPALCTQSDSSSTRASRAGTRASSRAASSSGKRDVREAARGQPQQVVEQLQRPHRVAEPEQDRRVRPERDHGEGVAAQLGGERADGRGGGADALPLHRPGHVDGEHDRAAGAHPLAHDDVLVHGDGPLGQPFQGAVEVDLVRVAAVRQARPVRRCRGARCGRCAAGARRAGRRSRGRGRAPRVDARGIGSAARSLRSRRSCRARSRRGWAGRRAGAAGPGAQHDAAAGAPAVGPTSNTASNTVGGSVSRLGLRRSGRSARRAGRAGRAVAAHRGGRLDLPSTGRGGGRPQQETVLPDLPEHLPRAWRRPPRRGGCGRRARRPWRRARARGTPRRRGRARRAARRAAGPRATRSIAPRTLLPWRTSGCSRVARVTATASSTSRSSSGVGGAGAQRRRRPARPRRPGSRWRAGRAGRARCVDSRVVPTLSYGFIEAITRKVGAACDHADARDRDPALGHRGQQRVERVLRGAVELLDVEEPALAHRLHQRPGHEVVGAVVLLQHPGRIVVADRASPG